MKTQPGDKVKFRVFGRFEWIGTVLAKEEFPDVRPDEVVVEGDFQGGRLVIREDEVIEVLPK